MVPRLTVALLACLLPLAPATAFSPSLQTGQRDPAAPVPGIPPLGPATPGIVPPAEEGEPDSLRPLPPPETAPGPAAEPAPDLSDDPSLPRILRSEADMPPPVQAMRARLIEVARSGDIERLRAMMEAQPDPPAVSFGDAGDPIDYLKALSSDADGREILAILLEVLESGFVRVEPDTPQELYVWPYFAQYPLEALTPPQLVELFTLLTAADYEDMRSYGSYTFFRVGIAPDGRWLFFLAGD